MNGFFITGTDTGIGKTVATAGLCRLLCDDGLDAAPMKPVQTGAEPPDRSPDLDFCLKAGGRQPSNDSYRLMCPYLFAPACSPHLAARTAGVEIDITTIAAAAKRLEAQHNAILVEGAGGVLVPLTGHQTMLDLMKALSLPVLLVSRGGLGTINHTLLSLNVLRAAGLSVAGVIFNDAAPLPDDMISRDNPLVIKQFGDVDILGHIPYIRGIDHAGPRSDAWNLVRGSLAENAMQIIKETLTC